MRRTTFPPLFGLISAVAIAATATSATAQDKPQVSFGAIADAQYAAEPDAPPRLYHTTPGKLADAVAELDRYKLDFVVHLGDFIDKEWRSYDTLLPIVRRSRHPWRFVLGNHDFNVPDASKDAVASRLGMPARYYSFAVRNWLFIVTDGNDLSTYGWPAGSLQQHRSANVHERLYPDKPLWDGGIDETQLRWIDAELTKADRAHLKAVLFDHFPLFPDNPHNLWNADAVIAVLNRHPSAKLWLDGHNHEGNYGLRNGIHYLNLKAMLDTPETAYARLDLFDDRIEVHGYGKQQNMTMSLRADAD